MVDCLLVLIVYIHPRIELKHGGKVLASNAQKFFSDGSSNTFHVHFDNPVQIEVGNKFIQALDQLLDGSQAFLFHE